MKAKTRRLVIVLVTGALVLVGTVVWNTARHDSLAQRQTVGLDEIKLACYDVRMAATYADGPYPGMAAGVLDVAVRLTLHASQLSPDWGDLNESVQYFHSAAHGSGGESLAESANASVEACQGIPEPDLLGSELSP